MIAELVYVLCAVTCLTCTILLARNYVRTRNRLVLWSSIAFLLLSVSNALIFIDIVLFPSVSLVTLRHDITLMGSALLLYGLIREST